MMNEGAKGTLNGRAHLWIRSSVLGLVAIFLALNGTAVAVQAAKDSGKGKDEKAGVAKKKKVKVKPGPPGPQGPRGPQGPQGPAGNGSPDTGPQILAKLAPVDGSGSGLDADQLDGLSSNAFIANGEFAGGHLSGTYPNPILNVSSGPCPNGQEISHDGDSTLNCSAGVYSDGSENVAAGPTTFPLLTSGTANTAVGRNALANNSNGDANSALGSFALGGNSSGDANSAFGYFAGVSNSTGSGNTAIGYAASVSNQSATNNTAVGGLALNANTASNNSAVGHGALDANTTGIDNSALGQGALGANTTANDNSALGQNALGANTTGFGNAAVGRGALAGNTTGDNNVAVGVFAGGNLTTGDANIAIGNSGAAAESNTIRIGSGQTRAFISGIRNVTTGQANAVNVLVDSAGQLGTASSSRRVKRDIAPLDDTGGLMRLKPVSFYYREGPAELHYGLLAEQVARVLPQLAVYGEDGLPETVQYQELPVLLLSELQAQRRQIARQQAQINRLTRAMRGTAPGAAG